MLGLWQTTDHCTFTACAGNATTLAEIVFGESPYPCVPEVGALQPNAVADHLARPDRGCRAPREGGGEQDCRRPVTASGLGSLVRRGVDEGSDVLNVGLRDLAVPAP